MNEKSDNLTIIHTEKLKQRFGDTVTLLMITKSRYMLVQCNICDGRWSTTSPGALPDCPSCKLKKEYPDITFVTKFNKADRIGR